MNHKKVRRIVHESSQTCCDIYDCYIFSVKNLACRRSQILLLYVIYIGMYVAIYVASPSNVYPLTSLVLIS